MSIQKILIVDDEAELRTGIALTLKINGFDVSQANSGAEALDAIVEMKKNGIALDLVITDIRMPNMTGEELIDKLKIIDPSVPVMIVTGFGDNDLVVRLNRLGCHHCVEKPIDPAILIDTVRHMIPDSSETTPEIRRDEKRAL